MSEKTDFVELAALWKSESKAGKKYLSGRMGNARVFVFFDTDKRNDRAPDARIIVAPNKDRENGNSRGNRQDGAQDRSGGGYHPTNDDMPF